MVKGKFRPYIHTNTIFNVLEIFLWSKWVNVGQLYPIISVIQMTEMNQQNKNHINLLLICSNCPKNVWCSMLSELRFMQTTSKRDKKFLFSLCLSLSRHFPTPHHTTISFSGYCSVLTYLFVWDFCCDKQFRNSPSGNKICQQ